MAGLKRVTEKQLAAAHSLGILGALAVNIPPVPAAQARNCETNPIGSAICSTAQCAGPYAMPAN
ncbi:MAG: hypothetical protein MUQ30_03590 [Anaerolineae bacterium]|nr:hypothetical protein [Anaerolineae bacterium]